jgi:cyclic pyranopterin phosphate synthase
MDVGNINGWKPEHVVSAKNIINIIEKKYKLTPLDSNYYGEVASRYGFADGLGEIGIISSVSKPFCSDCTRSRITADGQMYTCLFTNTGHDLRTAIRSENLNDFEQYVKSIWENRTDQYSVLRSKGKLESDKVEMFKIGG